MIRRWQQVLQEINDILLCVLTNLDMTGLTLGKWQTQFWKTIIVNYKNKKIINSYAIYKYINIYYILYII